MKCRFFVLKRKWQDAEIKVLLYEKNCYTSKRVVT